MFCSHQFHKTYSVTTAPVFEKNDYNEDVFSELRRIVELTNYRCPFERLVDNLKSCGVEDINVNRENELFEVCFYNLPYVVLDVGCSRFDFDYLKSKFVGCKIIPYGGRHMNNWKIEFTLKKLPNFHVDKYENDSKKTVSYSYVFDDNQAMRKLNSSECGKKVISECRSLLKLIRVIEMFRRQLLEPSTAISIQGKYKVYDFDYKSITLNYGYGCEYFVTISSGDRGYSLSFGRLGGLKSASVNPHYMTKLFVTEKFNKKPDLFNLIVLLNNTLTPLLIMCKLPDACLSISPDKHLSNTNLFTVMPTSATTFNIVFFSESGLEVRCRSDNCVEIRDLSFSKFANSKVNQKLMPIKTLATFLKYFAEQDKNLTRPEQLNDFPPEPQLDPTQVASGLVDIPSQNTGYAGAQYTVLTHEKFNNLCAPNNKKPTQTNIKPPIATDSPLFHHACYLEKFLIASLLQRSFCKSMKQENNSTEIDPKPIIAQDAQIYKPVFLSNAFISPHQGGMRFLCYFSIKKVATIFKPYPNPDTQCVPWSNNPKDIQVY